MYSTISIFVYLYIHNDGNRSKSCFLLFQNLYIGTYVKGSAD